MKRLNNPYVQYGYKGADYYCDREQETEELLRDLHNESNVALISPRRLGKSGLIQHVFDAMRTREPESVCIYIDILHTKNQTEFAELFFSRVIAAMDSNAQTALRKAAQFFKGIRPTMSFDEFNGSPSFSIDIQPSQEQSTIEQTFDYIAKSGKRCYIAFDEFQQITEYPEKGTEALLRSMIQFVPNVWFIFSGSRQHLMTEMFLSERHPFYLASQMMSLNVIDEKKYLAFANRFFKEQEREMKDEDFHYLYSLVDGQTWYVQEILHQLYEFPDSPLDRQHINLSIDRLLQKWSISYSGLYQELTDNQARVLTAIACEGRVKSPMGKDFMQKYRLPALSSTRQALQSLTQQEKIYHDKQGYIVYDRFLGMWLRRLRD